MVCRGAREVCVGGCRHDNGVAKGAGTSSGKGKECACNEPGACMSSRLVVVYVRTCVRARCARVRAWREGGGGRQEYYGLSVAR